MDLKRQAVNPVPSAEIGWGMQAAGAGSGSAVRATLAGVKAVTLSAPGVLLEEWDAAALQVRAGLLAHRVLCNLRELRWFAACGVANAVL